MPCQYFPLKLNERKQCHEIEAAELIALLANLLAQGKITSDSPVFATAVDENGRELYDLTANGAEVEEYATFDNRHAVRLIIHSPDFP